MLANRSRTQSRPTPVRLRRGAALLACATLLAGCDDRIPTSRDEETIPRESFIATMVELRTAAVRTQMGLVTLEQRDRILSRHGVSEEELRQFADVHGANVPMMNELWSEVERRIAEELGVDLAPEGEPQEEPADPLP